MLENGCAFTAAFTIGNNKVDDSAELGVYHNNWHMLRDHCDHFAGAGPSEWKTRGQELQYVPSYSPHSKQITKTNPPSQQRRRPRHQMPASALVQIGRIHILRAAKVPVLPLDARLGLPQMAWLMQSQTEAAHRTRALASSMGITVINIWILSKRVDTCRTRWRLTIMLLACEGWGFFTPPSRNPASRVWHPNFPPVRRWEDALPFFTGS